MPFRLCNNEALELGHDEKQRLVTLIPTQQTYVSYGAHYTDIPAAINKLNAVLRKQRAKFGRLLHEIRVVTYIGKTTRKQINH